VRPGSSFSAVGGSWGEGSAQHLIVRVTEPARDGRANLAATALLEEAFGLRRGGATLVRGARSASKTFLLDRADPSRLQQLLTLGVHSGRS
jgi:uncharacterized protein YggU (UPF0235/DUF167 family)